MTSKFLNKEKKTIYQKDFEEKVLTSTGSLKVSELLKPFLIRINRNPKLMTTWSGGLEEPQFKDSYVYVAYYKECEEYLIKELANEIKEEYKKDFQLFPIEDVVTDLVQPEEFFESVYKDSEEQLAATDSSYKNIWRVRIEYKSPFDEKHLQFWEMLTSRLEKLK